MSGGGGGPRIRYNQLAKEYGGIEGFPAWNTHSPGTSVQQAMAFVDSLVEGPGGLVPADQLLNQIRSGGNAGPSLPTQSPMLMSDTGIPVPLNLSMGAPGSFMEQAIQLSGVPTTGTPVGGGGLFNPSLPPVPPENVVTDPGQIGDSGGFPERPVQAPSPADAWPNQWQQFLGTLPPGTTTDDVLAHPDWMGWSDYLGGLLGGNTASPGASSAGLLGSGGASTGAPAATSGGGLLDAGLLSGGAGAANAAMADIANPEYWDLIRRGLLNANTGVPSIQDPGGSGAWSGDRYGSFGRRSLLGR